MTNMRRLIDVVTASGRAIPLNGDGDPKRPMFLLSELQSLTEKAPQGKKAERFIKKHKGDFKKRYGDAWEQVLYATAWKQFGKRKRKKN